MVLKYLDYFTLVSFHDLKPFFFFKNLAHTHTVTHTWHWRGKLKIMLFNCFRDVKLCDFNVTSMPT